MSSSEADDSAALVRRATALLGAGPSATALALLEVGVVRFPNDAALAVRHGDALQLAGRTRDAVTAYRRALALDDAQYEAWYGLGCAELARRAHADACAALSNAVRLRPDAAGARCNLAEALFQLGEVDAAIAEYRLAAETGSADLRAAALANVATIVPGSAREGNAGVLAARRAWIALAGKGVRALKARRPGRGRKLRIAYVSAFFDARNWMKPVFGVINHHARERFEVHMVSDGGDPSAAAGYEDHPEDVVWRVRGLPNAELARKLAAAEIDVLVDLNGYSLRERIGCFLYRPAPIQLGWFNLFATTGTPAYDALIGDAWVLPVEEEVHYCERVLRVPGSYLAFSVLYPVPEVAPPPSARGAGLTFGCLASAYKLDREVVAAWSRILRAAPASRLLLKNPTLDDASNRAATSRRFATEGVSADRLTLEGREEHFDFLRAYERVDVALDTFPYNGGTTTTEALWQGVPVLTFAGDRWAGRTSRSILLAAGLDEWVACDRAGYERAAIDLALQPATPSRLAALRARLRTTLRSSAACDSAALCRALESIYVTEAERLGGPGSAVAQA